MARFVRSSEVAFRQLGDECLLVPIRSTPKDPMSLFRLNRVSALVWRTLDEPRSVAELAAEVARVFAVSEADANRDVAVFVQQLAMKRLIAEVSE